MLNQIIIFQAQAQQYFGNYNSISQRQPNNLNLNLKLSQPHQQQQHRIILQMHQQQQENQKHIEGKISVNKRNISVFEQKKCQMPQKQEFFPNEIHENFEGQQPQTEESFSNAQPAKYSRYSQVELSFLNRIQSLTKNFTYTIVILENRVTQERVQLDKLISKYRAKLVKDQANLKDIQASIWELESVVSYYIQKFSTYWHQQMIKLTEFSDKIVQKLCQQLRTLAEGRLKMEQKMAQTSRCRSLTKQQLVYYLQNLMPSNNNSLIKLSQTITNLTQQFRSVMLELSAKREKKLVEISQYVKNIAKQLKQQVQKQKIQRQIGKQTILQIVENPKICNPAKRLKNMPVQLQKIFTNQQNK